MRDITLSETFNTFVNSRVNIAELLLEDTVLYQHQQEIVYNTKNIPEDVIGGYNAVRETAEKTAYRLGFADGLKLMATLAN